MKGLLLTAFSLSFSPPLSLSLSLSRFGSTKGYQFNRKKRVKDNSSFSAFYHLQRLSVLPNSYHHHRHHRRSAGRLSVWSNPGRASGYLSRKYLQATVQKPNLVCGRLILSYYIPSVDSSGLTHARPTLTLSFHPLSSALPPSSPSPPPAAPPPCPLVPTIPVNCPKLFDCPRKHVFRELWLAYGRTPLLKLHRYNVRLSKFLDDGRASQWYRVSRLRSV